MGRVAPQGPWSSAGPTRVLTVQWKVLMISHHVGQHEHQLGFQVS